MEVTRLPNSAGYGGSEATGPRELYRSTGGLVWSSLDCLTTRGDGGGSLSTRTSSWSVLCSARQPSTASVSSLGY